MSLSKNKGKLNDKPPKNITPTPPLTLPPLVPAPVAQNENRSLLSSIKDLESDLLAKVGKISPDDILKLNKHTKSKKKTKFFRFLIYFNTSLIFLKIIYASQKIIFIRLNLFVLKSVKLKVMLHFLKLQNLKYNQQTRRHKTKRLHVL